MDQVGRIRLVRRGGLWHALMGGGSLGGGSVDESDRVAHLPARGGSPSRPARPRTEGALPDLAGNRRTRPRLRARVARRGDSPGGDLPRLPTAPVELGGLLLLTARPARPPQTDRVARRGARACHDGGRRCDRTRSPWSAV